MAADPGPRNQARGLTLADAAADAGFAQPLDDLSLCAHIAVNWLVMGFAAKSTDRLGLALILAGSAHLLQAERQRQAAPALA